MLELIAEAGDDVLDTFWGGDRLYELYMTNSARCDPGLLNHFAALCYFGDIQGIKRALETGQAPPLEGTETPYKLGYATLLVIGSQRLFAAGELSARHLHAASLKLLLMNGCPPDVPDICRYTALSHATMVPQDNANLTRLLLEHGANVNHIDIYGRTPIVGAIEAAYSKAVDVLMEAGADLDIRDADGFAAREGYDGAGPKVTAIIHKWERRRAGEQVPLGERGCAVCGQEESLKFCKACHTVRYCSTACQRHDWPRHKPTCKPFSSSNTVTVRPRYNGAMHTSMVPMQDVRRTFSGFPGVSNKPTRSGQTLQEATLEYPKKMVIKVQMTPDGIFPALVYDSKREMVCQLMRDDAPDAWDRMFRIVRQKGTFGRKAYFAAELKSKDELVIKIDDVLADQPF
ncbi:ankyrin [Gloeopeniophorella convolvens]|nr:ankyrin [Gloeopeniophorella convolvens]